MGLCLDSQPIDTREKNMTLEYVLKAAVSSMIRGHHTPHCFSWYRNGVDFPATSPEYLEALEREATQEIENLGYASEYADGRDCGAKGVIWANWNALPRGLDTILERLGYSLEWSDCVSTCDTCYKAIQTEPDCYSWTPEYTIGDGYIMCAACLKEDPERYVQEELLNDPPKALGSTSRPWDSSSTTARLKMGGTPDRTIGQTRL